MFVRVERARLGLGVAIGVAALCMSAASPVAAATISATDCQAQSGRVTVRAVAISQGQTITLQQMPDLSFQGQGNVDVFCSTSTGTNLGDIPDAQVKVSVLPVTTDVPGITAGMFKITGDGLPTSNVSAATPGNPVLIGPMTGMNTFTITAPADLLPAGTVAADVGMQFEVVTLAYGSTLLDTTTCNGIPLKCAILKPGTSGDVLAATPELDSIQLFGTGLFGLAGYALMRRRAARHK